jgi:hypothetical protein
LLDTERTIIRITVKRDGTSAAISKETVPYSMKMSIYRIARLASGTNQILLRLVCTENAL